MRVICYGDSNTYGYDPRSCFGGRYPADSRWPELLARQTGCHVINEGECGRRIPFRDHALRMAEQALKGQPDDQVIVMLGTNDLLQGASAAETAAKMEAFLQYLSLDKENILLIAPPPMIPGSWVSDPNLIEQSVLLAAHYEAIAKRFGIPFLNAGCWDISLTFDGVHFTEEGHRAFAAALIGSAALRVTF